MSQEDKMAKMKSLREDSNTKIAAVLNDTQKQQFDSRCRRSSNSAWQQLYHRSNRAGRLAMERTLAHRSDNEQGMAR